MNIEDIMAPWAAAYRAAAEKEGWKLVMCGGRLSHSKVQVRPVACRHLPEGVRPAMPSQEMARLMVRTGTAEHHVVARKIIHDHFPDEWALLEQAAASVTT